MQPTQIEIDGRTVNLGMHPQQKLARAVIISIFAWRRAHDDDDLPAQTRNGWWGDSYADIAGDQIGSRLWLLSRSKLTQDTLARAREYVEESLAWLLEDRIARDVSVDVGKSGIDTMVITVVVTKPDDDELNIRLTAVWQGIGGLNG